MLFRSDRGYPVAIDPAPVKITWDEIRAKRNDLLKNSDWFDLPNSPAKNKDKWLAYRQALRDIPETFKNPEDVVWPENP